MDEAKVAEMMPKMARRVLKLKPNAAFTQEMMDAANLRRLIAPALAPAPAPKTKEELFKIIGNYVKNLNPSDYQEYSRYKDSERSYRIPKKSMPKNVKEAADALQGLKGVFTTIGADGGKFEVQPTPSELAMTVQTNDTWARQYVYRDAFETIGATLSDRNQNLSEQIKEIYKGAYKP